MMQDEVAPPKGWRFSPSMWRSTLKFFQNFSWRISPDSFISVYEIGYLHWAIVRSHPPVTAQGFAGHFINTVNWIRTFLRQVKRMNLDVFPKDAVFLPRKGCHNNQAFPSGTIKGARCFVSPETLLAFGSFCMGLPNAGFRASDWNRPYSAFL